MPVLCFSCLALALGWRGNLRLRRGLAPLFRLPELHLEGFTTGTLKLTRETSQELTRWRHNGRCPPPGIVLPPRACISCPSCGGKEPGGWVNWKLCSVAALGWTHLDDVLTSNERTVRFVQSLLVLLFLDVNLKKNYRGFLLSDYSHLKFFLSPFSSLTRKM